MISGAVAECCGVEASVVTLANDDEGELEVLVLVLPETQV
jgi:hypothetical protein